MCPLIWEDTKIICKHVSSAHPIRNQFPGKLGFGRVRVCISYQQPYITYAPNNPPINLHRPVNCINIDAFNGRRRMVDSEWTLLLSLCTKTNNNKIRIQQRPCFKCKIPTLQREGERASAHDATPHICTESGYRYTCAYVTACKVSTDRLHQYPKKKIQKTATRLSSSIVPTSAPRSQNDLSLMIVAFGNSPTTIDITPPPIEWPVG